jgi:hypothetical protein
MFVYATSRPFCQCHHILGLQDSGHVDHLPLEAERANAGLLVRLEGVDQLLGSRKLLCCGGEGFLDRPYLQVSHSSGWICYVPKACRRITLAKLILRILTYTA